MTTPNTDLTGQIAAVLDEVREDLCGHDGNAMADAVMPLVDAAVKRGQAEALRDAADSVHDNAASPYCLPCHRDDADLLHTIATEYEAGDQR